MDKKRVVEVSANLGTFYGVTREYQGITNDETETVVDNVANTIAVNLKTIQYATKYEFPNAGSSKIIYVDTEENKSYRWDEKQLKFYCVGSNYTDIKIINGGNANE